MKSYLSLIPISARVRRRQNRMTRLCVVFAVFLVTAVFSMADMGIRMEEERLWEKHGTISLRTLLESSYGQTLIPAAAILFLLILTAGVLMISGSMNSSVAQRTEFFGMMRCIGMSRSQVLRFVRLEALNWCKMAVPAGVCLGIGAAWILCAILRFLVGEEFKHIPLFGVSIPGIAGGVVVGVSSVLIAARRPAKRAARVSPAAAVSGGGEWQESISRPLGGRLFRRETSLGIRHAVSSRKNLLLMVSSFALSIMLLLCFSVLIEWAGYLLPQYSNASDIDISGGDGADFIEQGLADRLRGMDGVKRVYGRRSCLDIPLEQAEDAAYSGTADLISFDDFDLECLKKDHMLQKGSDLAAIYGDSGCVLAVGGPDSSWEMGDCVWIEGEELTIAGLLRYDPFSPDGMTGGKMTLIASEETFLRLTGVTGYSLIMIQTEKDVTEEEVEAIREEAEPEYTFGDRRDQSTFGTYLAFAVCVYGFVAVIMLVAVLHMINSISMSVSARMSQYGIMRAVGMEEGQVIKMIAAEACTYAFGGWAAGCGIGIPLERLLYEILIADHFPYAVWSPPVMLLVLTFLFVAGAALGAVRASAARIRGMSVTDVIAG